MSDLIEVNADRLRELVREIAREEIERSSGREPSPGRYLSAREAADLLGVSERTVQRMCLAGQLPAVQVGNRWKVRACDLPTP